MSKASASVSVQTHGASSADNSCWMCRASARGRRSASVCSVALAACSAAPLLRPPSARRITPMICS